MVPLRARHGLAQYTTVNRWWEALAHQDDLDEAELCRRADILERFSISVGRDPDLMISDVFDTEERRIRFARWSAYANATLAFRRSLDAVGVQNPVCPLGPDSGKTRPNVRGARVWPRTQTPTSRRTRRGASYVERPTPVSRRIVSGVPVA